MSETNDERATQLDAALAESQRLEREEQAAALERQHKVDQALADALAQRQPEAPPG